MGDNSIFIAFSNIWSSVHLKIRLQFQAFWQHRLFPLDMGSLKNKDSFSFYLSIAVLLVFCCCFFLYIIAANKQCVIIICLCPQNINEISLSRKNCHRNMLSNMPRVYLTHFAWQTFFHWISRVCQIKNIKYIHQYTRRPFH